MEKQELRPDFTKIRTFGRRHGKKLSARQQDLLQNTLPAIAPENCTGQLILEIGFGAGEHLRELAHNNPNATIIGAEPFMNGVASLLSAITDSQTNDILPEYKNIRVWADDVRDMLDTHNYKFEQIWILHPDPWPKAKHEKRRLLSTEFLNMLAQHLSDNGGQIIIGTDHWEYFDWIKIQASKTALCASQPDIQTIQTRYQHKNKAGTASPKYLVLAHI